MLRNSLRLRVAIIFAVFGAALSIVLSGVLFITAQRLGHHLMDESLHAELEDSVTRRARNPQFIPPNTVTIKEYVLSDNDPDRGIPANIKALPLGSHNVDVNEIDYRVLVADREGARYFLLFDTERQHELERTFFIRLALFSLLLIGVAAAIGFWIAVRVIAPVTRLAKQVGSAEAHEVNLSLSKMVRNDEVGELARAFERYLRRIQEFVERESYFTADVSHELRTPLAVILGTVEVLQQDNTMTAKQKERIDRIKRAVQDMIELTNALLLMARERLPAEGANPCQMGDVVRSCVDKHSLLLGDRPIRLDVTLLAEPALNIERQLFEVVVGNLLRNALFNTNTGTINVQLEATRLIVRDTGIGMRPDELNRAMERHYKGASSTGAGVGLSLVKRICDRYGWRITLESQPGAGTTVEVEFSAI